MKEKELDNRHLEIQQLLPWYVNKTVTATERESIDAHLAHCSDCLSELETLQGLSSVVRTSNDRLPFPPDARFDSLASRINEYESRKTRPTIGARFSDWWVSLSSLSRVAIVAQMVVLIVLTGTSIVLLRHAQNLEAAALRERQRADQNETLLALEKQRAIEYQALSGQKVDSLGPAIKITVVFREDATEKAIRELLLSIEGARIVSGPSEARFYVIGIDAPTNTDSQKLMNNAIAQLRSRSDVVQLAEPVQ